MQDLKSLLEVLNGGGQAALLVSVFFIWRLERRLARMEAALFAYLRRPPPADPS